MLEFPVYSTLASLPSAAMTLNNLYIALAQNLKGGIQDDSVMAGQTGGPRPMADKGPWLKERSWQVWQEAVGYAPQEYRIGPEDKDILIASNPTANRIQELQDLNGEVALIEDAFGIRETIRLSGRAISVDAKQSNNFLCILGDTTLFQIINLQEGQRIRVCPVNQGTGYAVIWDASIKWPAATAPVMPSALAGQSALSYIVIRMVNGVKYGERTGNYLVNNIT